MEAPKDHCVHFLQVRNCLSRAPPQPEDFEVWIVHRSLCRFCCCAEIARPCKRDTDEAHLTNSISIEHNQSISGTHLPATFKALGGQQAEVESGFESLPSQGEKQLCPGVPYSAQNGFVEQSAGQETMQAVQLPKPQNVPTAPFSSSAMKILQPDISSDARYENKKRAEYEKMLHVRRKRAQILAQGNDAMALLRLSQKYSIELDTTSELKDIFDAFDDRHTGLLTKAQLQSLLRSELAFNGDAIPDTLLGDRWFLPKSTTNDTQTVDFEEFLLWYQANCFEEMMLVPSEVRVARRVARKHNLPVGVVEYIHQAFEEFSHKPSHTVRFPEFCQLLYHLLHTQKERLSEDMLGSLCRDALGELEALDFEQFLVWYLHHFGQIKGSTAVSKSVLQEYFKTLRPAFSCK